MSSGTIKPYTDAQLAELKRHWRLTIGDAAFMTPEQKLADIKEWWIQFEAVGYDINKMDPNDPSNAPLTIEKVELSE